MNLINSRLGVCENHGRWELQPESVGKNNHQSHESHNTRVGSDAGHGISQVIFHEGRQLSVDGNVQLQPIVKVHKA